MSGAEVERLIWHMPTVAERATDPWAKSFATSIARQSRRRGWRPTPKQAAMMRRLVSDLFTYGGDDDGAVIE